MGKQREKAGQARYWRYGQAEKSPDLAISREKAGQARYWRYGQAEKSPDLAISDLSRFLSNIPISKGESDRPAIGDMGKQKSRLT